MVIYLEFKDLKVGIKVILFSFKRSDMRNGPPGSYKKRGSYTVENINARMIRLKKDTGYLETVNVFDLRQRIYRLQLEDGTDILFKPMPDIKRIERQKEDKIIQEYRETIDKGRQKSLDNQKNGTSIKKEQVRELWNKGKTPEEICQELHSTTWIIKGMLVKMGLIEKAERGNGYMTKRLNIDHNELLAVCKEHGTSKKGIAAIAKHFNISEKQAENQIYLQKIRREIDADKAIKQQEVSEEIKPVEQEEETMQYLVGNNIDQPLPIDTQEFPDITEVAENLSRQVDDVIKNIPKLSEAVNHPTHYTTGRIEVIDYLLDKLTPEMFEGFCIGNALKYLSRYRLKGGMEDLKKAQWYLNKIISVKTSEEGMKEG
jgi:hypothetical protein